MTLDFEKAAKPQKKVKGKNLSCKNCGCHDTRPTVDPFSHATYTKCRNCGESRTIDVRRKNK